MTVESSNVAIWYIPGKDKQPAGPFTADQILQALKNGRLMETTICWREGMPQWLPLTQIEPFSSAIHQSISSRQAATNSTSPQPLPIGQSRPSGHSSQTDPISSRARMPIALRVLPFAVAAVVIIAVGAAYLLTKEHGSKNIPDKYPKEMGRHSSDVRPSVSERRREASLDVRGQLDNASESPKAKKKRAKSSTEDNRWTSTEPGTWLHEGRDFRLQLIGIKRFRDAEESQNTRPTMNQNHDHRNRRHNSPVRRTDDVVQQDHYLLEFAVTKLGNTESPPNPVSIVVIDDHDNRYTSILPINLQSSPVGLSGMGSSGPEGQIVPLLPNGFVYLAKADVLFPREVVVKGISVADTAPIVPDKSVGATLKLLNDFGTAILEKGALLQVGKWLSFRCQGISPELTGGRWEAIVRVNNKEYNSLEAVVLAGVQYPDGTLYWGKEKKDAKGSSETELSVHLNLPLWTKQGPPQPVALFLLFENKDEKATAFRIIPMSAEDMPPRVGQSEDEADAHAFESAYSSHGGREMMGNPVSHVRWLAGGDKPRDEKDVVVQHFPKVSQFGKSAILWDKQHEAKEAYVIHGPAWEKYLEQGKNGQGTLGSLIRAAKSPETGYEQFDFEGGYVASTDGRTLQTFPYEDGKIAFTSDRDGNREIYVTDPSGRSQVNLTNNPANDWSPKWSPDGNKIAFVSDRGGSPGIYAMDADGSNVQQLTNDGEDPAWFPDGSKIVFVRKVLFAGKNKFSLSNEDRSLYGLFTMSANGDSQKQLPIDARSVKMLPDGRGYAGHIRRPNVSPDGKTIAFSAGNWDGGHQYEIYLFHNGTRKVFSPKELHIATRGMACDTPVASRDGKKLAFRQDNGFCEMMPKRGGRIYGGELYWMGLSGTPSKICDKVWCWGGLDWSADGQSIVFSGDLREGRTTATNLCIVRLDQHVARYITCGKGNNYDPSWWTSRIGPNLSNEETKDK